MKVLYVIPGSENKNAFSFSKEQIRYTQKTGIETHTFYVESRLNPFTLIREYFRYKKELKAFNPDIIHAHYGTVNGYFASLAHSKPFVITFHGSDLNPIPVNVFREKLGKILSHKTAKKANKIICVSDKLKQRIKEFSHKTEVIPMGADDDFFIPIDRNECIDKLGLGISEHYILFNGSDPVIKRTALAEKVLEEVRKTIPLTNIIILSGNVDKEKIRLYLNACSALLVCSVSEGSPVIVKEAMASNLPIVSTDVGDIKIVTEGCFPGAISDDSTSALAQNIIAVLKNAAKSNGREILHEKGLTISESVKKVTNIYNTFTN